MINSPIRWVGGKSRLRQTIISLLPEHSCYVEPFAGAAWVLFAKPPSDVEVLNDKDEELINFFRVLRTKPEELLASFEWELVSRAEFNRLADLDPYQLTEIQRAHRFYYIIMAGWGTVMYIDPPYPGNKCNYKHNMQDWADHERLSKRLAHARCKWILSSYDAPEVHALYGENHIIPVQAYSGMKEKKDGQDRVMNKEVLIANYLPTSTLVSPNSGLRQAILSLKEEEAVYE